MYFDTHAHYDDAAFDPDRDALLSAVRKVADAHEIVETETGLEDAFIHLMNQAQDNFKAPS